MYTNLVLTGIKMQNITLSADKQLIEAARKKASEKKTSLNAEFRRWLQQYANTEAQGQQYIQTYRNLMREFSDLSSGGQRFSRDEMNERG
jgi:predicted patatin/cPLA2 family phospholipase